MRPADRHSLRRLLTAGASLRNVSPYFHPLCHATPLRSLRMDGGPSMADDPFPGRRLRRSRALVLPSTALQARIKALQFDIAEVYKLGRAEGIPRGQIAQELGLSNQIGRGINIWNMWLSHELAQNAHLIDVPLSDWIRDVAKPAYDIWRDGKSEADLAIALEDYTERFTAKCQRTREEDPQAFRQTLSSRRTQLEKFLKRNRHSLDLHYFLVTFSDSAPKPAVQCSEGMLEHMEHSCGSSQALMELLSGVQSSIDLKSRRTKEAARNGYKYVSARDLRRDLTDGLVTLIRRSAPDAAKKLLKKQPTGVPTLPWSSLFSTLRDFNYTVTGWPSSASRYILDAHGTGAWHRDSPAAWKRAVGLTRPGSWQVEALREVCIACKGGTLSIQSLGSADDDMTSDTANSAPNSQATAVWTAPDFSQLQPLPVHDWARLDTRDFASSARPMISSDVRPPDFRRH